MNENEKNTATRELTDAELEQAAGERGWMGTRQTQMAVAILLNGRQ